MTDQPTAVRDAFADDDDARMREFYAAAELLAGLDRALRRPYLTYAGTGDGARESLLVAASVRDTIERCNGFAAATGLTPVEQFFADPVVTVPMPISVEDETSYRNPLWAVPAMLWHPLAWLPWRQACRMAVAGPDGDYVQETLQQWAVRLAWELTATGLYDEERGWVDVLALHGIDISSPAGHNRVARWFNAGQHGDPVLDTIDLAPYFDALDVVHEPGWSFQISRDTYALYQSAAWSVATRTLLEEMDAGAAGSAGGVGSDLEQLKTIAVLAYIFLERVAPLGELGGISPYEALMDLADELALGDENQIAAPADVLQGLESLRRILLVVNASTGDAERLLDSAERERHSNLQFAAGAFLADADASAPTA